MTGDISMLIDWLYFIMFIESQVLSWCQVFHYWWQLGCHYDSLPWEFKQIMNLNWKVIRNHSVREANSCHLWIHDSIIKLCLKKSLNIYHILALLVVPEWLMLCKYQYNHVYNLYTLYSNSCWVPYLYSMIVVTSYIVSLSSGWSEV